MRLSEAIRLGALLKPQGYMSRSLYAPDRSCVLGAAADAVGLPLSVRRFSSLLRVWPSLMVTRMCPACAGRRHAEDNRLLSLLWHLNDEHRWTREAIADFVATLESPPPADAIGLSVDPVLIDTAR